MTDAHWIEQFLSAHIAERGAAANTVAAYRRDLADLSHWLGRNGKDFANAAQSDIVAYLSALDGLGMSAATRARRLSAIRQLYRFAVEEHWRTTDPATRLSGPRKARSLPGSLTEAQVLALLAAAGSMGTSRDRIIRNTCLMELLYATGMRVSELVTLPVASVRGNPAMLLVRGKGGKERMVPLSDAARASLGDWLALRDRDEDLRVTQGHRASPFLFPASGRTGHLTRERFFLLVRELAVHAGIPPAQVSPHTLRHAFATHLLANGADLRVIQTLLGHSDIATTEIYTHVIDERLKDLVLTRHPLA